jgi:hypothetical protein
MALLRCYVITDLDVLHLRRFCHLVPIDSASHWLPHDSTPSPVYATDHPLSDFHHCRAVLWQRAGRRFLLGDRQRLPRQQSQQPSAMLTPQRQ